MSIRLAIIVVLVALVGILAIIGWRAPERPHLKTDEEKAEDDA
jgi:hypothetical protein